MVLRLLRGLLVGVSVLSAAACGGAPAIPHAITSQSDSYCLGCHQGGAKAPRAPHPERNDCTGCHQP